MLLCPCTNYQNIFQIGYLYFRLKQGSLHFDDPSAIDIKIIRSFSTNLCPDWCWWLLVYYSNKRLIFSFYFSIYLLKLLDLPIVLLPLNTIIPVLYTHIHIYVCIYIILRLLHLLFFFVFTVWELYKEQYFLHWGS